MERQGARFLDFSGRATTAPCGGEDGSRRKKCNSQDQRMAAGYILDRTRESKMEIAVYMLRNALPPRLRQHDILTFSPEEV
jgi:hypothetical protein